MLVLYHEISQLLMNINNATPAKLQDPDPAKHSNTGATKPTPRLRAESLGHLSNLSSKGMVSVTSLARTKCQKNPWENNRYKKETCHFL